MSEVFKNRMDKLKKNDKLSDYEYEQLLCLNGIEKTLISIDDSLNIINLHLAKIEVK